MCQFQLELSWFWIGGNGRFLNFLTFYVPLCSKKLSVQWDEIIYEEAFLFFMRLCFHEILFQP